MEFWVWVVLVAFCLLAAVAILGAGLLALVEEANARSGITRELFEGGSVSKLAYENNSWKRLKHYRRSPLRFWWARAIELGIGATLTAAGVSAMFSTPLLSSTGGEGAHPSISLAGGAVAYVGGLLLAMNAWTALVEPLPPVPSSPVDAQLPGAPAAPAPVPAGGSDDAPSDPTPRSSGGGAWPVAAAAAGLLTGWMLGRRARGRELS